MPADLPRDVPADLPRDVPADLAADVPRDVPRDVVDAGAPVSGLDTRPSNRTCVAFPRPVVATGVTLVDAFPMLPALTNVTTVVQRPGDSSTWYVTEQPGRVRRFSNSGSVSSSSLVVDISARVSSGGEAGLLGVAFHPRFASNGQVYLSYTGRPRSGVTEALVSRISRFRSTDAGATVDPASEEILMEISQPYTNHNGGHIAFGPDGYLYAGFGDGGSGGDPMRNGQNVNTLLGKFLRIDVDSTSPGRRYAIPADNPFARGGGSPEIFAWGVRNPWKWSFDRVTGELWAGDVGQGAWEEVDLIRRGGNYGWNVMEGLHCYSSSTCAQAGLTLPVVEYGRGDGQSITGGYVYRGAALPWLTGAFVYGDFNTGRVWAVLPDAMGRPAHTLLAASSQNLSTFAQDPSGEVYAVTYGGRMLRLSPGATTGTDRVPRTLTATGCVDTTNPLRPASGLIPYAPNAPFWSDGAEKDRFMAVPDGQRITINPDGDWDLPVGTVLVKNFTHGGRRIETRLFVRHTDGDWAGYTYRWNDAQTDAALLQGSDVRDLGGGVRWLYPSRSQCMQCHTTAAGRTLGLETAQLNGDLRYDATGRTANQLTTLERIGMFTAPLPMPPSALPAYPSPYGTSSVDQRARAYLHTNCAPCHRPGSTGRGNLDLRYATAFAMTNTCNVAPATGDLGVTGARVILPGDPARSVLNLRARATDLHRMPPISSNVVDAPGTDLLDQWVRALRSCM